MLWAKKTLQKKMLADYNDVFADIINVLLFDGNDVVNENELQNTKDKSQYKADGKLHEQERDLSKIWQKCNIKISFIGIENQTKIDDYMPLRVIGYDGAIYRTQYNGTDTIAYPVITIVLNFSKSKWDKNKKLSDIMTIPEELRPYFQDYSINVFDICYLSKNQVNMFKSDFGVVAEYFVETAINSNNYKPERKLIKHVDEILKMMRVLTGDVRFEEIANDIKEGDHVTMCEVLERIEQRGIEQGIEQGIERGIERGIEKGKFDLLVKLVSQGSISIQLASEEAGLDIATFKEKMNL